MQRLGQMQLLWKKFVFKNNLKPHILVNHVDPADSPKVLCNECGRDFADKPSLKDHSKVKHSQEGSPNVKNVIRHLQGLIIYNNTCMGLTGWKTI